LATTRVYILAKELGVKSSAIVQKCQDESLDVKNHMSAISAGLAATIREWFSEGENITTVETSKKVNLKKVRVKKKKKVKQKRTVKKIKKAKPSINCRRRKTDKRTADNRTARTRADSASWADIGKAGAGTTERAAGYSGRRTGKVTPPKAETSKQV
jgi:hypothetical protein